jgi:uncharacterized membrane protein
MSAKRPIWPGAVGLLASSLGLFFSAFSTHDYAINLDRQLHGAHCSFVPGLVEATSGPNPCSVAMTSPYSALFRDKLWGGVPISLFALGAYVFFFAASLHLLIARESGAKRTFQAYGVAALTPLPVSIVMLVISITKLNAICKLCTGLYTASGLLALAGVLALVWAGGPRTKAAPEPAASTGNPATGVPMTRDALPATTIPDPPPTGSWLLVPAQFALLALAAVAPALIYVASVPDYRPYLAACGKLDAPADKHGALVKMATSNPQERAISFEDPLCPTCKAFHETLVSEGVYDRLDISVAVFPLDSECNWMLDRPLHPGACQLARAVICGDKTGGGRLVLEWAYAHQDELREAGKAGPEALKKKIVARFPDVDACLDSKDTKQRLDRVLQFAVANKVPVSTPQLYLGEKRLCDEDTDLGLRYAIGQIAPKVNP